MTTIPERLSADLKDSMRAGDRARTETIRNLRAALQSAQLQRAQEFFDHEKKRLEATIADPEQLAAALGAISADAHTPLGDDEAIAVIQKEIKRRRDAAEMYQKANRAELAAAEEAEIAILNAYLPQMLSADDLRPQVAALIAELGLSGPSSMGKLMPVLLERFKQQAEGRVLSQLARELLSQ